MRRNFTIDTSSEGLFNLTRISVYSAVLFSFFFFFRGDFAGWLDLVPLSAWTPVGVTRWLLPLVEVLKSPSTTWIAHVIGLAFLISTGACIVGWKWRFTSMLTLLLSLVVFGLKNSFGHAFRSESILILAQFLMILGPGRHTAGSVLNARETLFLLRLMWVSMFFLSALNKLRFSGWDWAADNFLQDYLLANQITRAGTLADRPFAEFAHVMIAQPIATLAIGYFVLLFELLYPLILIKRLKIPILVGTLFFQLATFTLLGVNFLFYVPLLPIWLKETPSK